MKSSITALVFVLASATAAVAQPTPGPVGKLTPPAGWTEDVGRSAGLMKILATEPHFGDGEANVSAQHLHAPTPGGILLTTQVITRALPTDPGLSASRELAALKDLVSSAKMVRWQLDTGEADKLPRADYETHDDSLGTSTIARAMVFQTGGQLVRLTAECVIADDAVATLRAPCEAALATLAPLAPASERVALVIAAEPPPAPEPTDLPPGPPPATMSEGANGGGRGDLPTTIVVSKPKSKRDNRPYIVIVGLIVLAAVFWWNRKQRARVEAEQAKEEREKAAASKEPEEASKEPAPGEPAKDDKEDA